MMRHFDGGSARLAGFSCEASPHGQKNLKGTNFLRGTPSKNSKSTAHVAGFDLT
jgi:hypothetical protein